MSRNMKTLLSFIFFSLLIDLESHAQPLGYMDMSNNIPIAGTQGNLSDVQVIGNNVWVTSSNPANIFRSTDSGNTFTAETTSYGTQAIFMFSDASNGCAVGSSYGYKTTDGGTIWNRTTIGGTLYDVYFPTSLIGYAVGNSGVVYKTENGGANWAQKTIVFNASVLSVVFPSSSDPNTGYVALANAASTVFKTTNGGTSWTTMTLPGIISSMSYLEFIDANTGWAAGGYGEIFSYKNGTWTKQTSPVTTTLNGISFASDGLNGWAVGNAGVILHTTNGGTTWVQDGSGLTAQNLTKVDVVSSTEAYIVGYGKTFIKYTNSTTNIEDPVAKPASFNLEQNYPNPFNQTTHIPYSLSVSGNVKLTVYNMLGEQVALLVDVDKPIGSFTANFNGDKLLPGIYYYHLQVGNNIEMQKMLMIK
jgi:photosystem II stability/assembly factor-like uncharacterized protein